MKKLFLSLLMVASLLCSTGSIALANDEPVFSDDSVSRNESYTPGEAPAQIPAESMAPAIHAVLLAMGNQGLDSFTTENEALSWEMLYNLLSMYGQLDARSAYEGELLVIPSETVADYSAALFAAPLSPDSLPAELADRMTYDAQRDSYFLYCGSDGLAEVVFSSVETQEDGVTISGKLMFVAENLELAAFSAVLSPADNLFGYTLTALDVL